MSTRQPARRARPAGPITDAAFHQTHEARGEEARRALQRPTIDQIGRGLVRAAIHGDAFAVGARVAQAGGFQVGDRVRLKKDRASVMGHQAQFYLELEGEKKADAPPVTREPPPDGYPVADEPADGTGQPRVSSADTIEVARRIVQNHQAEEVEGTLLDATTANMLVQVHDALSPNNQQKFTAMSLGEMVGIGWELLERAKTGHRQAGSIDQAFEELTAVQEGHPDRAYASVGRRRAQQVTKVAPEKDPDEPGYGVQEVDDAVPVGTVGEVATDVPQHPGAVAVRWPNGWVRYYDEAAGVIQVEGSRRAQLRAAGWSDGAIAEMSDQQIDLLVGRTAQSNECAGCRCPKNRHDDLGCADCECPASYGITTEEEREERDRQPGPGVDYQKELTDPLGRAGRSAQQNPMEPERPAEPKPAQPGQPGQQTGQPGGSPPPQPGKVNPARTKEVWDQDGKFSREVEADGVDDLVRIHRELNDMGLTRSPDGQPEEQQQGQAQPAAPLTPQPQAQQQMPQGQPMAAGKKVAQGWHTWEAVDAGGGVIATGTTPGSYAGPDYTKRDIKGTVKDRLRGRSMSEVAKIVFWDGYNVPKPTNRDDLFAFNPLGFRWVEAHYRTAALAWEEKGGDVWASEAKVPIDIQGGRPIKVPMRIDGRGGEFKFDTYDVFTWVDAANGRKFGSLEEAQAFAEQWLAAAIEQETSSPRVGQKRGQFMDEVEQEGGEDGCPLCDAPVPQWSPGTGTCQACGYDAEAMAGVDETTGDPLFEEYARELDAIVGPSDVAGRAADTGDEGPERGDEFGWKPKRKTPSGAPSAGAPVETGVGTPSGASRRAQGVNGSYGVISGGPGYWRIDVFDANDQYVDGAASEDPNSLIEWAREKGYELRDAAPAHWKKSRRATGPEPWAMDQQPPSGEEPLHISKDKRTTLCGQPVDPGTMGVSDPVVWERTDPSVREYMGWCPECEAAMGKQASRRASYLSNAIDSCEGACDCPCHEYDGPESGLSSALDKCPWPCDCPCHPAVGGYDKAAQQDAIKDATGGRVASGYTDCACRDCFDVAIDGDGKPALCGDCEQAGCSIEGDGECQRADAYGMDQEGQAWAETSTAPMKASDQQRMNGGFGDDDDGTPSFYCATRGMQQLGQMDEQPDESFEQDADYQPEKYKPYSNPTPTEGPTKVRCQQCNNRFEVTKDDYWTCPECGSDAVTSIQARRRAAPPAPDAPLGGPVTMDETPEGPETFEDTTREADKNEYQRFVEDKAKEWGIDHPFDQPDERVSDFFEEIDREWGHDKDAADKMSVECLECGKTFKTSSPEPKCPKCGSYDIDLAKDASVFERLAAWYDDISDDKFKKKMKEKSDGKAKPSEDNEKEAQRGKRYPCPSCGKPDAISAQEKAKGYQCRDCTYRDEGGEAPGGWFDAAVHQAQADATHITDDFDTTLCGQPVAPGAMTYVHRDVYQESGGQGSGNLSAEEFWCPACVAAVGGRQAQQRSRPVPGKPYGIDLPGCPECEPLDASASRRRAQPLGMPPAAAGIQFEKSNERSKGDRVVWDLSWEPESLAAMSTEGIKQQIRSYVTREIGQRQATDRNSTKNWGFSADPTVEDIDVDAGIATVSFMTSEQAAPQVAPAEATE